MNVKVSQFSINQVYKNFFAILKKPRPSGWTAPMTWTLCILPVALLLVHPFDAQISIAWSEHTTKFQHVMAASTNMIKSVYWLLLGVLMWGGSTFYLNKKSGQVASTFIVRGREAGIYLFFAIICSSMPVTLIKYLVGRARPHLIEQVGPEYFAPLTGSYLYLSFPSGHAMMAGILIVFSLKFLPLLSWVTVPLCFLLTFSRVIVAAHYPTDILAGFTIGVVVSLWLYNFLKLRNIIAPPEINKK
ncbi:phosphatase PAP2 family protein [Paenochrobactrum sp. BZR 588]|uniref:phosphatase PAP2 family protein n=1 Tax=unclassified Paenochrobactrum TaxID=2639760 RepID=UPI0038537164